MKDVFIARWESRGGAHYCELWRRGFRAENDVPAEYYSYRGSGMAGTLPGEVDSDAKAVWYMERRMWAGKRFVDLCQPDANSTPVKRVN